MAWATLSIPPFSRKFARLGHRFDELSKRDRFLRTGTKFLISIPAYPYGLLWVISRHFAVQSSCPLYPRKRTFAVGPSMSAVPIADIALSYSITSSARASSEGGTVSRAPWRSMAVRCMSALDIRRRERNVCYGPIADITRLIRSRHRRVRAMSAGTVRPSILAIVVLMNSSNLSDCTTGKSAGLAPLKDAAGINADLTPSGRNVQLRN